MGQRSLDSCRAETGDQRYALYNNITRRHKPETSSMPLRSPMHFDRALFGTSLCLMVTLQEPDV